MKSRYKRILAFSGIFMSIFCLHLLSRWWIFRTTGIYGGVFFDLQSVTNSYDCFKIHGLAIYKYDPSAICVGGFMYGISLMYFLELILFLTTSITTIAIIGCILVSITLGTIAHLLWNGTKKSALFLVICLSSPGIWLMAERGNVDEWILVLLSIASISFSRNRDFLGVFAIVITVLLKFYTLPLLFLIVLVSRNKKLKILSLLAGFVLAPITIWNISLVHSFPSSWFVSFGVPVLPKYGETIGVYLPPLVTHAIGVITVGLLVILIKFIPISQRKFLNSMIPIHSSRKIEDVITTIFGATFIICYFSGTNYDYRLVYLAIFGSALTKRLHVSGELKMEIPIILLISLWCTDFFFSIHTKYSFGIWQFIGDSAMALFVALTLFPILSTVKLPDKLKF